MTGGFLMKDLVLLGAAVATCGEALRAARARIAAPVEAETGAMRVSRAAS